MTAPADPRALTRGDRGYSRNDGRIEVSPGRAQTDLEAGEAIEIVTPTGGGWGPL